MLEVHTRLQLQTSILFIIGLVEDLTPKDGKVTTMFESAFTFHSFWPRNSEPFQSFPSLEHWATCCHQEGGRQHNYLGTVFAPSHKGPRCQFHQDMDICQLRWSLSDGLDGNPARGRISLRNLIETSWNLACSVLEVFWVFVYGISLLLNSVFKPMAEISLNTWPFLLLCPANQRVVTPGFPDPRLGRRPQAFEKRSWPWQRRYEVGVKRRTLIVASGSYPWQTSIVYI